MSSKKGTSHSDQIKSLKRIEGQVRGLVQMVEDQRYCVDILTQMKAVKSALNSVERKIIMAHLNHCVHSAVASKSRAESKKMIDEIQELLTATR